jgi:hypothetical protein
VAAESVTPWLDEQLLQNQTPTQTFETEGASLTALKILANGAT